MKTIKFIIPALVLATSCSKQNNDYDAMGTFEATEIIVSAENNGKLINFDITEGSRLEKNNIVGCIDTMPLTLKIDQLRAAQRAVSCREADIPKQIAALQEQISKQKTEKKRTERLLKDGAANQKTLDDIDAQLAVLQKQLTAQLSTLERSNKGAWEELESYQAQIAQIEDQISKCRILAPVSGQVLVKYTEPGEFATTGRPLFKMADLNNMFLRAYLNSVQLSKLKVGDAVQVNINFGENDTRSYPGVITWISDKAEFTPKTIQTKDERDNLVYAVKISVKNEGYLKIGMYGDVKLKK